MFRFLRPYVDRYAPYLGYIYRRIQEHRALKSLKLERTEFGFSIWGGNWLASGAHEHHEINLTNACMDYVDALVDVGANVGLYSCLAAARGVPAVSVEPQAMNLNILYRNLIANDFQAKVEVLPVGAADKVGLLPIYGRGQSASLLEHWGGNPVRNPQLIPVTTLDNLFAKRYASKKIFLKIVISKC